MKYLIIIVAVAIAGYFFSKRRIFNETDADRIKETYVCDKCGETLCYCHKEEA